MNSPAPVIGNGARTGFDLLAPLRLPRGTHPANPNTMTVAIGHALRLLAFAELLGRVPTAGEIASQFGVSRAAAQGWHAAFAGYYSAHRQGGAA